MVEQSQADHMVKGMCTPLGPVANMHQCISDQMPLGARDPLSMELAEQAAIAVDFPKTGVPPCIPSKGDCYFLCSLHGPDTPVSVCALFFSLVISLYSYCRIDLLTPPYFR